MSKYLIISDLHFGADDDVDNFKTSRIHLLEKLDKWKTRNGISQTIIAGDIYELWQGKGLTENRRLKRIMKRYDRVMSRLINWTQLSGNHDWLLHTKYHTPEEYIIEEDDVKIVIMHGHQFDSFFTSKPATFMSRVATEAWGLLEKAIGTKKTSKILTRIEGWWERRKLKKQGNGRDNDENEYVKKAIKYAKKYNATHIILGHTHGPMLHLDKRSGLVYANSGTWIDEKAHCIIIDTEEWSVKLCSFSNGKMKTIDTI